MTRIFKETHINSQILAKADSENVMFKNRFVVFSSSTVALGIDNGTWN